MVAFERMRLYWIPMQHAGTWQPQKSVQIRVNCICDWPVRVLEMRLKYRSQLAAERGAECAETST